MATSAILTLDSADLVLQETFEAVPEVRFECERIVKSGEDSIMPLLWAHNADTERLEAAFSDDPTVEDEQLLADVDDEQLYQMEWIDHTQLLVEMLTNGEATILDAYAQREEWQLRVLFPSRDHFSSTHAFCESHGLGLDVEAIREIDGEPTGRFGLTDAQYEALVTAARRGYFQVPQEHTLEEVADELDVSHQSLSERIRRGTEALVEDTLLIGHRPDEP